MYFTRAQVLNSGQYGAFTEGGKIVRALARCLKRSHAHTPQDCFQCSSVAGLLGTKNHDVRAQSARFHFADTLTLRSQEFGTVLITNEPAKPFQDFSSHT
jgi:hypothetical protein